jgi:hypothetical protein
MNLAECIYKEGDVYFFDTETYTDEGTLRLSLDYEDGDRIIWKWDDKRYSGVLREAGANGTLFKLDKITPLE